MASAWSAGGPETALTGETLPDLDITTRTTTEDASDEPPALCG
jgi:hypothetical protein